MTAQIHLIEDGYRSLTFPFEEVSPPPFRLVQKLDRNRLAAHMGTWSGSQRYRKETGRDPLEEIREELVAAWGDPDRERDVAWICISWSGYLTKKLRPD